MTRTAVHLTAAIRPFRSLTLIGAAGAAAGALAAVFGSAAWAARLGWFGSTWWVFAAWGIALGGVGVAANLAWRRIQGLSPAWLADQLEAAGFRRGSLRALLEGAQAGTSDALRASADTRQEADLRARGPSQLDHLRGPFRSVAVRGLAGFGVGIVLLFSSRPTQGAPSLLWRPGAAWAAIVAPLRLSVVATEVERGTVLPVFIEAAGRRNAILWTRAPGESWRGEGVVLDSAGQAALRVGPLDSDLFLRLTSGGRSSDTLQVRVRIPAFLGALEVMARYPAYLGLEDEPLPTGGDTVAVPEGTRLETRGTATAPVLAAAWTAGLMRVPLEVNEATFTGMLSPRGSRVWTLEITTAAGGQLAGDTIRIPVVVVPDGAPTVRLPVPGADTVVPLDLRVPLVIEAEDDHRIMGTVVESRRVSRLGIVEAVVRESVPLPEDGRDHLLLPHQLVVTGRGLLPGDTLRVRVRATDNSPRGQSAVSEEYALRLPTLAEMREATRKASRDIRGQFDSVTQASRGLERSVEDLATERPRAGQEERGRGENALAFENERRAEAVAQAQETLVKDAEAIQEALEALKQGVEAAGLDDPAWQERLREVQDQLARALTPELRERLAELRRALEELDPERTQEALQRLAEAQKRLREALERSRELFERAALEGDLATLAAEARDLASTQREWSEQVESRDSVGAARNEQELAARTDSLASALERTAHEMTDQSPGQEPGVREAADQAQQAAAQMRRAGASAQAGQRQRARREGQQAAEQLAPLGGELDEERTSMQDEWRQEVVDALDQVLGDASRLAERQLEVAEALGRQENSPRVRSEQGAVEEGVERLLEEMRDVAGKNALVGAQPSVALAAARDAMRASREALGNAAPNTSEAGRRAGEAVDALNSAAHGLIRARGAVGGAASGSGLAEAMEQMRQMSQQQGQIGQQAGGMLPMLGQGGAAMQEQLRALGARQRALAERLERMRSGGQIPGAADMANEARDVARALEAGRLDRQTVERQERLFRRMLDAGRTLQGQEEDERRERQSATAGEGQGRVPPPLTAGQMGRGNSLLMPSWEELRALPPEERRQVIEYFRRLDAPAPERR